MWEYCTLSLFTFHQANSHPSASVGQCPRPVPPSRLVQLGKANTEEVCRRGLDATPPAVGGTIVQGCGISSSVMLTWTDSAGAALLGKDCSCSLEPPREQYGKPRHSTSLTGCNPLGFQSGCIYKCIPQNSLGTCLFLKIPEAKSVRRKTVWYIPLIINKNLI